MCACGALMPQARCTGSNEARRFLPGGFHEVGQAPDSETQSWYAWLENSLPFWNAVSTTAEL